MLTIYFSNHEPDAIGAQFVGLLGKCRILVVENGSCDGSEAERTRLLNQMAAGKLKPTEIGDPAAMFRGFELEIGKAVYGTGKRIILEDSPWSDKEEGKAFLSVFDPPNARSLDEAPTKLRAELGKGGELARLRDEAYATQLSELAKQNPSTRILAMMSSGHERAVSRFLKEKGVTFQKVTQTSTLPSTYRSIALERAENNDALSRIDLLRCLSEMCPLHSFAVPSPFNGPSA